MSLASRAELAGARRIVVKVGSSSISGSAKRRIPALVQAVVDAYERGSEVLLVSSGAIATGMPFLELDSRPTDLATQQAAAAVGQNVLVYRYQEALRPFDITAAQVLLTSHDLADATHRSNARRAIDRLLGLRVLPIVNENDTVATHEIRFGDNDRLAALVARMVGADALVLLSDVDSLYTRPPSEPGAERLDTIEFGSDLAGLEFGATVVNSVGTGGAATKASAARLAAAAGIGVLVTSADLAASALRGDDVGTWFAPADLESVATTGPLDTLAEGGA
ncbi:glutamate 5-kinase [Microbacterium halophytorum]|uniref:glutamate 5-kinase n=1 Tax=Microbacterium halophytorum TaxID=2067568 RepID=UPI000CFD962D|nr:glutamate 5-kinase [Microbacterium halophytorum]